jgi:hypothetical protein
MALHNAGLLAAGGAYLVMLRLFAREDFFSGVHCNSASLARAALLVVLGDLVCCTFERHCIAA